MNDWNLDYALTTMPWILVTLSTSSKCTVARSSASALALPRFHDRTHVAFAWDVRSAIAPPPFCFRDTMSSLLQLHQNPWLGTLIKIWIDTTYSFSTKFCLLLPWLSCSLVFPVEAVNWCRCFWMSKKDDPDKTMGFHHINFEKYHALSYLKQYHLIQAMYLFPNI